MLNEFRLISFTNVWLLEDGFESALGTNKICGRWSNIEAVMLPDTAWWEIILENILSMRLLEWLVNLVGCKIYSINEFEAKESKNILVGWWSLKFNKLILKSPRKKTCLFSLDSLSRRGLTLLKL